MLKSDVQSLGITMICLIIGTTWDNFSFFSHSNSLVSMRCSSDFEKDPMGGALLCIHSVSVHCKLVIFGDALQGSGPKGANVL